MNLLRPNDIQYDRVLVFVTDAASYMIKADIARKVNTFDPKSAVQIQIARDVLHTLK
jgi:hypothetical protein